MGVLELSHQAAPSPLVDVRVGLARQESEARTHGRFNKLTNLPHELLGEAHFAHDPLEPLIIFERLEARIDLERDQFECPILARFHQPAEPEIGLAEGEANRANSNGET